MARTVLVTGASGGIGGATARELGRDHNILVHYYRNEEEAKKIANHVEKNGNQASIFQGNLSISSTINEMISFGLEEFGYIDVLVNNAGIFHGSELESISKEAIQQTLQVNLEGVIYCTKALLPMMRQRDGGRIVNISSGAAIHGSPSDPVYAASKSGLLGLTKSLARQYTKDGIFVNAIAPGATATKMFAADQRPEIREKSPIDRLIKPKEVAEVVRLFATTNSISGQILGVDGGIEL